MSKAKLYRIEEDQGRARFLRAKGDPDSIKKAEKIEARWKDHPSFDQAAFRKPVGLWALLSPEQRARALSGMTGLP